MKTPAANLASAVSGTNLNSSSLPLSSTAAEPHLKKAVSDKATGTEKSGLRSLGFRRTEDIISAMKEKEISFDEFLTEFKNNPKVLNDIRGQFFEKFYQEAETVILPIFKIEY